MRENLKSRVMTALVGIPLLIFVIVVAGQRFFSVFVLLLTVLSLWEYYRMVFPGGWLGLLLGMGAGTLIAAALIGLPWPPSSQAQAFFVALLGLLGAAFCPPLNRRFASLGWIILGLIYLGVFLPHFALLHGLPSGKNWVFFLLVVIMVGDTAGYAVGSWVGTKKLSPKISPNKTVEGALGFTLAGLAAGLAGRHFLLPDLTWAEAAFLSLVMTVLGQSGDLFESWIKRFFSVKDSGALLPGHGGIMDRLDSLIFPSVFLTYYVRLVHG